ncbi:MAG TPA: formate dehydrogenase accessory sulfurtransferase FdhD [Gemmata sp.]
MLPADANNQLPRNAAPASAPARVVTLPTGGTGTARDDSVAVEAPLELRIGGKPVTVLMRTPGHDEELVTGFLFGEGVIADADDIIALDRPATLNASDRGNVVDVRLMVSRRAFDVDRPFYSNSSCGICGKKSLAAVEVRGPVADSPLNVSRGVLGGMPDRLRSAQLVFAETGGVHASGLFTPAGALVAVREDVGRHNALDKIIGWALNEGRVPLADHVLLVSGRVSYELVQKAIAAGIPVLAAVGAPSSLAVDLATTFGITLIGFLRAVSMNVYAHPHRVTA